MLVSHGRSTEPIDPSRQDHQISQACQRRLARAKGVELNEIQSDIMGDLRTLRNVILHSKSVIRPDKHASLRLLGDMFEVNKELAFSYEGMHQIFVLIKQECARLLFEWLGVEDGPVKPEEFKDVAI